MKLVEKYKNIYFVDFPNLTLDFSQNYFNEISFNFKNVNYTWKIIGGLSDASLKLFEEGSLNVKALANTVLKHADFDFILYDANQNAPSIVQPNRLFIDVKLGILQNE